MIESSIEDAFGSKHVFQGKTANLDFIHFDQIKTGLGHDEDEEDDSDDDNRESRGVVRSFEQLMEGAKQVATYQQFGEPIPTYRRCFRQELVRRVESQLASTVHIISDDKLPFVTRNAAAVGWNRARQKQAAYTKAHHLLQWLKELKQGVPLEQDNLDRIAEGLSSLEGDAETQVLIGQDEFCVTRTFKLGLTSNMASYCRQRPGCGGLKVGIREQVS
eukprot:6188769-Pleurochrysis_carterae.AAC.4